MFFSITEDAGRKLGMYDFFINNALAGAVTISIVLLVLRFVLRALILSWLGRRGGTMVIALVEAAAVFMFIATAWRNPGVLVASIAWGAVIYNTLLQTI
ncbi:hypothetical protein DCCM_3208 [Desulfocucumis palustris]|uniref:Uncharacterized protein n=1 Tax=Desulfocucumis palustris TaxID=1898651 RepID=A0A2L2XIN3_9FIRM|nr:hypothetical protein [Desulfocucumis palustris]GBF34096.1 hypothetical protein DCCM_3208 [Desulfocucumis palustris]